MEAALTVAGYGVLMWASGYAVSYKILTAKRLMEEMR